VATIPPPKYISEFLSIGEHLFPSGNLNLFGIVFSMFCIEYKTFYSLQNFLVMNLESRDLSGNYYGSTTSTDTNDLSKVVIGALAGAALGSLVAGAFTQKGIEIRNRVGEGSKNIANNLKDKVSDMTGAIADKYEAAKEGAADLIEKGKQKVGMSRATTADTATIGYKASNAYMDSDYTEETGQGSKILLGALIVSVAGTIVWSFATEKGNETRRRVAKGSRNMASNIKEKVSDVASGIADGVSDAYQSAKQGAEDLLEQQKQRLNDPTGNTTYKGSTGAENL
jgi:gas vesicle protein